MKPETLHPAFPDIFDGLIPVFGIGSDLVSLRVIKSVNLFPGYPVGSKKRADAEKQYWLDKDREYTEVKELYDKYCYVGTIFKGNTQATAKITKINTTHEVPYVCYKASDAHIKEVEEYNEKYKPRITTKPIPSGNFSLKGFLSSVKNGTITILSVPIYVEKINENNT